MKPQQNKHSKMLRTISAITLASLCAAGTTQAVLYTWEGGTDNVWTNTANWDANGLPATNVRGVTGSGNTIVIQNGANMPTTGVPTWNGGSGGTPRFVIQDGASLSTNMADGGWDGPVGTGTIVTVGSGASLTWGNDDGTNIMALTRDGDGTQTFNINGGTFTIDTNRLDMSFNENRHSAFNLDGGTFAFAGTQIWGTQNGAGSIASLGALATINLDNGSSWDMSGAVFQSRLWDSGGAAAIVFDIKDTGSSLTAKFGGQLTNLAQVQTAIADAAFISSTGLTVQATDNTDGTFTINTIPEPSSTALLGLGGLALILRRRK